MIVRKEFKYEDAWLDYRKGLFTASEISRLMTDAKKKDEVLSVGAITYVHERVAEILAPTEPIFYSSAMEHGKETEAKAAKFLQKLLGISDNDFVYTSENGIIFYHDTELDLGGTPDVIILVEKVEEVIFEIKCPLSKTHLEYLMLKNQDDIKSSIPKYYAQMQLNMHLTKTNKCFFISYDDRFFNKAHQYHSVEVARDEDYISKMLTKAKHAKEYKNNILKTLEVCAAV